MRATLALERICTQLPGGSRVLEIGPGEGLHTAAMNESGLKVTTIGPRGCDVVSLFPCDDFEVASWGIYDGIFASHVLEHSPNPGRFLSSCRNVLKDGGLLCITVPPPKTALVGGHLTLWTPLLLCYNAILAGFDCSSAWLSVYGYNISLAVYKGRRPDLSGLVHDCGDIERLAKYFPVEVWQNKDGFDLKQ
jgi:SAM-dependent methyltransferase